METCRACLATDPGLVPLDESFIKAYNLLTDLKVELSDAMPQYVCLSCSESVQYWMDFRERCVATEVSLRDIIMKQENNDNVIKEDTVTIKMELDIKSEVKEEMTNDDSYLDDLPNCDDFNDEDDMMLLLLKSEKTENAKPKRKYKKRKLTLKEKIAQTVKPEVFPCGLCHQEFSCKEEMAAHVETHKHSVQCAICLEVCYNWPNLLGHRLKHIPKEQSRCHVCNKAAFSSPNLEHHYMNLHFDGEKCNLKCKECGRSYETPRKLRKHISSVHSTNILICDHCSKVFTTRSKLKTHLKFHSDVKPYVCDTCGVAFKHTSGLGQHKLWKHSLIKFPCKICRRVFQSQEELDRHMERCEAKMKICPICGIQVKSRFAKHLESHSSLAQFQCGRCPASFRSREALRTHCDRHDGRRTKQCEYCPLKFYTTSVLIKHRRVHTGEKPYVCKVCNKGFTGNHNLKVHMKVHGEYLVVKKDKPDVSIFAAGTEN